MREIEKPMWPGAVALLSLGVSLGAAFLVRRYHDDTTKLNEAISFLQHQVDILEVADCVEKNRGRGEPLRPLSLADCRRINMTQFAYYQNARK